MSLSFLLHDQNEMIAYRLAGKKKEIDNSDTIPDTKNKHDDSERTLLHKTNTKTVTRSQSHKTNTKTVT